MDEDQKQQPIWDPNNGYRYPDDGYTYIDMTQPSVQNVDNGGYTYIDTRSDVQTTPPRGEWRKLTGYADNGIPTYSDRNLGPGDVYNPNEFDVTINGEVIPAQSIVSRIPLGEATVRTYRDPEVRRKYQTLVQLEYSPAEAERSLRLAGIYRPELTPEQRAFADNSTFSASEYLNSPISYFGDFIPGIGQLQSALRLGKKLSNGENTDFLDYAALGLPWASRFNKIKNFSKIADRASAGLRLGRMKLRSAVNDWRLNNLSSLRRGPSKPLTSENLGAETPPPIPVTEMPPPIPRNLGAEVPPPIPVRETPPPIPRNLTGKPNAGGAIPKNESTSSNGATPTPTTPTTSTATSSQNNTEGINVINKGSRMPKKGSHRYTKFMRNINERISYYKKKYPGVDFEQRAEYVGKRFRYFLKPKEVKRKNFPDGPEGDAQYARALENYNRVPKDGIEALDYNPRSILEDTWKGNAARIGRWFGIGAGLGLANWGLSGIEPRRQESEAFTDSTYADSVFESWKDGGEEEPYFDVEELQDGY